LTLRKFKQRNSRRSGRLRTVNVGGQWLSRLRENSHVIEMGTTKGRKEGEGVKKRTFPLGKRGLKSLNQ